MAAKEPIKWQGSTTCDFCKQDCTKVGKSFFDGKTDLGPWALMCVKDFANHGQGLGQGWGQQYDSKTLEKVAG